MCKVFFPSNRIALYAAQAESQVDRDALVESALPKVRFVAERVAARLPFNVELDDLIGAGVLGLLDAADRFDPAQGVMFKTYAELRIRGAMLDSLRHQDWAPRSVRRRARAVQAACVRLEQSTGRPPDETEIAAELGIPLEDYQKLLGDLRWLSVTSLTSADEDEEALPLRQVADRNEPSPLERYEHTEMLERLAASIDRLPERERQVVALYYLEELTMKEIGSVLNITESRVSQLHSQAIVRMRAALTSERKTGFTPLPGGSAVPEKMARKLSYPEGNRRIS